MREWVTVLVAGGLMVAGLACSSSLPTSATRAPAGPVAWEAKWITGDTGGTAEPESPLSKAKWIWFNEEAFKDGVFNKAPAGTRYFERGFRVPAGADLSGAVLHVSVDNESKVFVNGELAGTTTEWQKPEKLKVGRLLKADEENGLFIEAVNTTDKPNPAGVIAALVIPVKGKEPFVLVTDGQWRAADTDRRVPCASTSSPVRVVGEYGKAPWAAIAASRPHPPVPIFRKEFDVPKKVERAVVHVSGLGQYKMYLNGKAVGDHFLDPAWSNYEKTVYYNSFDVTDQLKRGGNAMGVMLGRSYYSTKGDRRLHGKVSDRPPVVIAQLEIEYADGSRGRVVTDGSWEYCAGPYLHDSLLGGVTYDAGKLPEGWDEAGTKLAGWTAAEVIEPKLGKLEAQPSPSLRTYDEFAPVSVNEPAPGRYVYDFGQNASATVRLKVKGEAGRVIRLTYAEQREGQSPHKNDGKGLVDQSGIRSPNYIEYVCKGGGEESWFCDLFYSGFQYMELTGGVPAGFANPEKKPVVTGIRSVHVRSGAPVVGTFECSDPMIMKIDRMIDWSVRSNLSHVLTDCPHREKMGWLEVPHLMWDSIAARYDLSRFGPKVCEDIRDAQRADGMIPTVAPAYGDFPGGFGYTPEWGAAGVLIPWDVYYWYGDRVTLEKSYPMMRGYVEYMRSTCKEGLVPAAGLGDWYDYVPGKDPGPAKLTPPELSAMAIFYQCTTTLAETAHVLGNASDEVKYRRLASEIRADFNKRFYTGNGVYKNTGSCQTANAMALVTGLAEERERPAVVAALVEDLKRLDYQQTSGDVGFHYLVRALADNGQADALYRILARPELGSYAFLVNGGWTTLPEAWDAHHQSSMNHCMLGHIQEFFTRNVCGIQALAPGYKRILIKPVPGGSLTWARASLETVSGRVTSAWVMSGGKMELTVNVPASASARVELPDGRTVEVGAGEHRLVSGVLR